MSGTERPSLSPRERQELLARLQCDAARIAAQFGLSYREIQAEHPRVKDRYGVCYADGLIKIRLTHARTGEPLRYSSLVDTLCHELAHLRHFNHGPEFKAFFWQLLGWARREGIYRPAPRGERGARAERDGAGAPTPLRPETRNGIPVFVRPQGHPEARRALPLWEAVGPQEPAPRAPARPTPSLVIVPPGGSEPRPTRPRRIAPAVVTAAPKREEPRRAQLALPVALAAETAAAPSRPSPPPRPRAPTSHRAPSNQLRLF